VIGGGKCRFEGDVTIAYIGFIRDKQPTPQCHRLYKETQVLLVDELQMVTPKALTFFKKCKQAYFRFGFSGSFYDNPSYRVLSTTGYFGPTITKVTDQDLLDSGRGVAPVFKFYEYALEGVRDGDNYGEIYRELISKNINLNEYFTDLLHPYYDSGQTILILVQRVAHCELVQRILNQKMIKSKIYNGHMALEDRKELREGFKEGRFPVLVATAQTFGVGMNIPRIEVMLNLAGGLSDDKAIQKYGRGLRSFDGKSSVTILEALFTGNKWFAKHSRARLRIAKSFTTSQVFVYKFGYKTPTQVK
jgi:superfamily II DNA or RNA helicase